MFQRIGKLFAILAMMATAVTAQCALTCALEAAKPKAHDCCKSHKQKPQTCANPTPAIAVVNLSHPPLIAPSAHGSLLISQLPSAVQRSAALTTPHASPGPPPFSPIRV